MPSAPTSAVTPPAASPTIDQKPQAETTEPTATFTFEPAPNTTVRCSIDGAAPVDCTKGLTLNDLAAGEHTLVATQTDAAGNASAPATYKWVVKTGKVVLTARIAKKGKVAKNTVTVICKLSGDTLKICNVKIYARVGKKTVVIATGRRAVKLAVPKGAAKTAKPVGKATLGVKVKLNKVGKRLLARKPKVTSVTIQAKAQPAASAKVASKAKAKISPAKKR